MTTPAILDNRELSDNPERQRPKYAYDRNGHWWYVYKITYIGRCSYGEKISKELTKQEAEKETYRLNGWELKK